MDNVAQKIYFGMDVSDKFVEFFALTPDSAQNRRMKIENNRESLSYFCQNIPDKKAVAVAMENGTHSPWMSALIESFGIRCYVGNARKLAAVWCNVHKCDRDDAEMLARLAKADIKLFAPIKHASMEQMRDLAVLKIRDKLVHNRSSLICTERSLFKSLGIEMEDLSVENFSAESAKQLSPEDMKIFDGLLISIRLLSQQIKLYDKKIAKLCKKYEVTERLQTVPGVGPVISLAFALIVGNPERIGTKERACSYMGLVPRRDQSGNVDKQLGITKTGNQFMRRLLIQGANYIISRTKDSDLRRFGEKLSRKGDKISRRKAKVALARKLCAVMYSMWKNETDYEPFYKNFRKVSKTA